MSVSERSLGGEDERLSGSRGFGGVLEALPTPHRDLSHAWPPEEKYEIGSQVRRSSNSSPAQLAEKNDDRHVRNKIEGVNRSRGEAAETIHHLFMAREKGYIVSDVYESLRTKYKECIRMLNGLEKTLERKLQQGERRWFVREHSESYSDSTGLADPGWPVL